MDDAIIEAIYAAVTQDEVLGVVLEALARRFGCHSASMAYVDARHPADRGTVSEGFAAAPF